MALLLRHDAVDNVVRSVADTPGIVGVDSTGAGHSWVINSAWQPGGPGEVLVPTLAGEGVRIDAHPPSEQERAAMVSVSPEELAAACESLHECAVLGHYLICGYAMLEQIALPTARFELIADYGHWGAATRDALSARILELE